MCVISTRWRRRKRRGCCLKRKLLKSRNILKRMYGLKLENSNVVNRYVYHQEELEKPSDLHILILIFCAIFSLKSSFPSVCIFISQICLFTEGQLLYEVSGHVVCQAHMKHLRVWTARQLIEVEIIHRRPAWVMYNPPQLSSPRQLL